MNIGNSLLFYRKYGPYKERKYIPVSLSVQKNLLWDLENEVWFIHYLAAIFPIQNNNREMTILYNQSL
jgi:hypothetical protein